ncbi:MAG: IS1595 family transposase [Abitibacteriaceae bacterium]|nr:IS1595 family transposase [Abditibacteriaceae bacterium]
MAVERGRHKCRACGQRQSFRSVWHSCRLSEASKRKLLEHFVLGVPAYRLRFRSPASLAATERFFLLIRRTMALLEECDKALVGSIECDESAFGGKRKGKRGWGAAGKTLVFGLLKRNGVVRVFAVSNRQQATLLPLIEAHTAQGCLYYTDDYEAYASLQVRGEHVVVTKDKGRPKGRDHINGIEGFWSYAKHWLYMYRGVPQKFVHLYLAETSYRFNHREQDLFPLLLKALKQIDISQIQ